MTRGLAIVGLLALWATDAPATTMTNPAALLCEANGAKVVIETAETGAQRGVCVFADGAHIDEWAYFRSKHLSPGLRPPPTGDQSSTKP